MRPPCFVVSVLFLCGFIHRTVKSMPVSSLSPPCLRRHARNLSNSESLHNFPIVRVHEALALPFCLWPHTTPTCPPFATGIHTWRSFQGSFNANMSPESLAVSGINHISWCLPMLYLVSVRPSLSAILLGESLKECLPPRLRELIYSFHCFLCCLIACTRSVFFDILRTHLPKIEDLVTNCDRNPAWPRNLQIFHLTFFQLLASNSCLLQAQKASLFHSLCRNCTDHKSVATVANSCCTSHSFTSRNILKDVLLFFLRSAPSATARCLAQIPYELTCSALDSDFDEQNTLTFRMTTILCSRFCLLPFLSYPISSNLFFVHPRRL